MAEEIDGNLILSKALKEQVKMKYKVFLFIDHCYLLKFQSSELFNNLL